MATAEISKLKTFQKISVADMRQLSYEKTVVDEQEVCRTFSSNGSDAESGKAKSLTVMFKGACDRLGAIFDSLLYETVPVRDTYASISD